jgi:hypothetical protein
MVVFCQIGLSIVRDTTYLLGLFIISEMDRLRHRLAGFGIYRVAATAWEKCI